MCVRAVTGWARGENKGTRGVRPGEHAGQVVGSHGTRGPGEWLNVRCQTAEDPLSGCGKWTRVGS